MEDKQIIYKHVFGSEYGKIVLSDLVALCFGTVTTFSSDPLEFARREGKREVLLEILTMLKVDLGEVFDEYLEELV